MSWGSYNSDNPKLLTLIRELSSYSKLREIDSYLDLGCASGELTLEIARTVGARNIYGVDMDEEALNRASAYGIKVLKCDLSKDAIPLLDESLDLITALDIIEHLLNPDHMLKECHRLLRRGGSLIITTPNMASWYNRALLLLGHPVLGIDLSTEYRYRYPLGVTQVISGHVRLYTVKALRSLVESHGFRVIKTKGFQQVFSKTKVEGVVLKSVYHIDRLMSGNPSLAANILLLASR